MTQGQELKIQYLRKKIKKLEDEKKQLLNVIEGAVYEIDNGKTTALKRELIDLLNKNGYDIKEDTWGNIIDEEE